MVRSRLIRASVTAARAAAMSASAPLTSAAACSMVVRARSSSARELLIAGERLRILQLHAGIVECRLTTSMFGFCLGEPRFGLGEPRLKRGRVEPGQHLPRLDPRVEIGRQRRDRAGDLRSHFHHPRGLERAAHQDPSCDRTARDFGGLDLDAVAIASRHGDRRDCPNRHRCDASAKAQRYSVPMTLRIASPSFALRATARQAATRYR